VWRFPALILDFPAFTVVRPPLPAEVDFDSYKNSDAFQQYVSKGSRQKKANVEQYRRWKTFLISDHLPLWAELTVIEEGS